MSGRGTALRDKALAQLGEADKILSDAGEPALRKPYSDRTNHAGNTVGAAASHFAEGYQKVVRLLEAGGYVAAPPAAHAHDHSHDHAHSHDHDADLPSVLKKISDASAPLAVLAELTDEQLDSIPPLRNQWADGERTLATVLDTIIDHQSEHLASLRDALT